MGTAHAHYHYILYSSALFLLLLSPAAVSVAVKKEKCNPQDKKVLLAIKYYYNNAFVFNTWTATTDCCTDWLLVECDETTHRITTLVVQTDGLPGVMAPAIGDLPYLKSLYFRKLPNITGPIPTALAKLTHLETLTLDWNSLTGPVPDFPHTLKNLSYVNLSFNTTTFLAICNGKNYYYKPKFHYNKPEVMDFTPLQQRPLP